jgi:hypothetical protein
MDAYVTELEPGYAPTMARCAIVKTAVEPANRVSSRLEKDRALLCPYAKCLSQ